MPIEEIRVPDIGDFDEIEVIEILVKEGDLIKVDDPVITVESDKASMDIPTQLGGEVKEIKITLGDKVSEGSLILVLDVDAPEKQAENLVKETPPASEKHDVKTSPLDLSISKTMTDKALASASAPSGAIYASPSVRHMAREKGIDLSLISGTGPKGRISKQDLDDFSHSAVTGADKSAIISGGVNAIAPIPGQDFSVFGEIEVQPLTRIQKISGPHLHRAWLNVPMVTHHDEVDITELEAFRKSLKAEAEKKSIRITALVFIMKALASSLKKFPIFNASLAEDGENLILKKYVHIGIAVDTDKGLMVPVLRNVDQKSIYQLSDELGRISKKARDGKLSPKDLQGGCMSISSLGGIGGSAFTPIVNAPEVAILGVTRSQMKPIWNGSEFIPRLMLPLDLSYDHRVIDGANAARFVVDLGRNLSDLRRLLL